MKKKCENQMQLTERLKDVINGSENLEDLHTLSRFPVFMGAVQHDQSEDIVADMSWSISRDTGVIQLKRLLPLDVVYKTQTTTSAIGSIWMAHHKAFAEFIAQYSPSSVLELGGAHGILAKEYQTINVIPWTILEPNPSPVEGCNANYIKGFFDEGFSATSSFDTIVHSHVFEHIYEPNEFMKNLQSFIPENGKMIFSLPNLLVWLERKYTNCINFEHTVFLTEPYVDYLLAKNGFEIIKKEYYMNGHSIFYSTIRHTKRSAPELPKKLYEINKKIYEEFVTYHIELIVSINSKIALTDAPIYLFGAHIFTQYLLAFGLNDSKIISLLDNDANKQNKRLYGTNMLIQSPEVLRDINNPIVILKAGIYNEEIKQDILNKINSNTIFI